VILLELNIIGGVVMPWSLLIFLIILFIFFFPIAKNRSLNYRRFKQIKSLEEKRESKIITLIHRQEILSLVGIPFTRYIDIDDSEEILRAIRATADEKPIDLILHTPGGLVLAAEQIARAVENHSGNVTVMIPHYAMSGGTLIALAADEIIMDHNAVLGPVDPQISGYPAESIMNVARQKSIDEISDETLILDNIAQKAVQQLEHFIRKLLKDKLADNEIDNIIENLCHGKYTHDFPITCEILRELKLDYSVELPEEVYNLMELYPQPKGRKPSVYHVAGKS